MTLRLGFYPPFPVDGVNRQYLNIFILILFKNLYQVRKLRTTLPSLRFPEMNDDDLLIDEVAYRNRVIRTDTGKREVRSLRAYREFIICEHWDRSKKQDERDAAEHYPSNEGLPYLTFPHFFFHHCVIFLFSPLIFRKLHKASSSLSKFQKVFLPLLLWRRPTGASLQIDNVWKNDSN